MNLIRLVCFGAFVLCVNFAASHAFADVKKPLTKQNVESFLESQKSLELLSAEMLDAGVEPFFTPRIHMVQKDMPLYITNVENLEKQHPQYYKRMASIVSGYDYGGTTMPSTPEDWARNADRVMITYFAATSSSTRTGYDDMMQRMTPEMLAMMPEQARAKLQPMFAFMKSLKDVTPEDKAVVMEYKKLIDIFITNHRLDSEK